MTQTLLLIITEDDCVRLNGCGEVLLIEDMQEHVHMCSEYFQAAYNFFLSFKNVSHLMHAVVF